MLTNVCDAVPDGQQSHVAHVQHNSWWSTPGAVGNALLSDAVVRRVQNRTNISRDVISSVGRALRAKTQGSKATAATTIKELWGRIRTVRHQIKQQLAPLREHCTIAEITERFVNVGTLPVSVVEFRAEVAAEIAGQLLARTSSWLDMCATAITNISQVNTNLLTIVLSFLCSGM